MIVFNVEYKMKKNNYFYSYNKLLTILSRILAKGKRRLFFWTNKEKPNSDNTLLARHEKFTTDALSKAVPVVIAEPPNSISDEAIWKAAEEVDALKLGENTKRFTIKEANAELAKPNINLNKLTQQEELFFQELENEN